MSATPRIKITESQFERMLDARILWVLRTDRTYLHAESAEAQTAREEQIEADAVVYMNAKYDAS